jgi:hypothetical protein
MCRCLRGQARSHRDRAGMKMDGSVHSIVGASLLAKTVGQLAAMLDVPTPSRASPPPTRDRAGMKMDGSVHSIVGASSRAKAVGQLAAMLDVPTPSRASPLPQRSCWNENGWLSSFHCGSGLAREGGGSVGSDVGCADAFAGKPAPTGISDFIRPWQCRATVRLSTRSTIRHTARPADSQPGTAQTGYGTPSPRIRSKRPVPTQSARPVSRQSAA